MLRIIAEISSSDALVSVTDAPCSLVPAAKALLEADSCSELTAVWSAPSWSESEIEASVRFVFSMPERIVSAIAANALRVVFTVAHPIRVPRSKTASSTKLIQIRLDSTSCRTVAMLVLDNARLYCVVASKAATHFSSAGSTSARSHAAASADFFAAASSNVFSIFSNSWTRAESASEKSFASSASDRSCSYSLHSWSPCC